MAWWYLKRMTEIRVAVVVHVGFVVNANVKAAAKCRSILAVTVDAVFVFDTIEFKRVTVSVFQTKYERARGVLGASTLVPTRVRIATKNMVDR